MIFLHKIPSNVFGISTVPQGVVNTLVVHDVQRGIWAQVATPPLGPTLVGYIPALSDGQGGILQLSRAIDAKVYTQQTTGFGASLDGTTLTVTYPSLSMYWNGSMQNLSAGSVSGPVTTGTWVLTVSYNWGLTQVSLVNNSSYDLGQSYMELCRINVNTSTGSVTVTQGAVNSKFLQTLCVNGPSGSSYGIPVSGASGVMPW